MVVAAVLALGIAGLIFGLVHLATPREPTYQGKTLSEWIAPFCRQTAKGLDAPGGPEHFEELQPARNAVRQIGTNAVPILIAKLNHRESGLHRTARELSEKQPYVSLRLPDPYVSKIRAIRALANLGPAAEPAIPILKGQLGDATLSLHAVYALSGLGAEGIRALVQQYTNVSAPIRMLIAQAIVVPTSIYRGEVSFDSRTPFQEWAIGGFYVSSSETTNEILAAVLIDGFSQVARDRASPFQMPAILRLGNCGPQAINAIPILIQVLRHHDSRTLQSAIYALGQIRSQPEVVVPALNDLLGDPDLDIQTAAAKALGGFEYRVYDAPIQSERTRPILPLAPGRTNKFRSL